MADRSGIEIDYCPTCRGVWLDRGELDKIIERTANVAAPAPAAAPAPVSASGLPLPAGRPSDAVRPEPRRYRDDDDDDDDDRRRYSDSDRYRNDGHRPKKRKSLLGEIFDF
jgi:Zn-finger nucleic acid-binding protein